MRHWLSAAFSAALVLAALTGCGASGDTDGDLTDDWQPVAEARQFTPRAGVCHESAEPTGHLTNYQPVDCRTTHLMETVHVGTLTGAVARRSAPPRVGSAALRPAFAECDQRAREFVGGDWRAARLSVQVAPASPTGWQGGSRWYRCDLFVLDSVGGLNGDNDTAVPHTGSLRGALGGGSPVRLTCFEEDEQQRLRHSPCDAPHRFEYAGTWTAPEGSSRPVARDEDDVHARCRPVVARYARVPVDGDLRYRTGTAYRLPSESAWARGDRGVRCFFWSGGRSVTSSIRDGGATALPVG
ncbi:septum formation family protein [Micromonospora sp. WMMA1923]|uniref:septum formation family protein n=1 Tax=Micromonospora sp. WMMA1923 TaxID=3404125 RepID=UPI003B932209